MVFNSLQFLWFFLIVYGVYRILPAVLPAHRAHRSQNWLLLIASYYFYAAWDYRFVTLLAASTIVDYTCGRVLGRMTDRRRRRAVMWVSIGFNLAMLGFFKYFNFFAANLQALFGALGWQVDFVTLRVLLPIGISFYTFVTMSYVIDVYRRHIHPTRDFVDFAVFVSYFPHLVAGPILRATALLPQIARPRRISGDQIRDGLWLIAWGFFQKIVVADNLAPLASHVFAPEAHPTGINVLLGTYAFAFQIYGDFAGYSNIARGTSKLMGIELIENFRFPYLVVTPQAFWRNWHISLSTWLRDYLYIPLGGSRGTPAQTRRNLLITMILGGLWHGAAWTFVLWGLYQGVLLVLYRPFEPVFAAMTPARRLLAWLLMFHLTCYGWLIFRAPSPGKIGELTRSLLTHFSPSTMDVTALVIPLLLYTVPLLIVHLYEAARDNLLAVPQAMTIVRYSVYAATVYLIFLFGNFGGSDFIYFQF
ncbi:MAG TPA: MBOAT family O-acyltransferase [Vicinamibacterales bacterium]|nr:MBOAT family O-acyltransferase [Vicinamibacterales bacterium]